VKLYLDGDFPQNRPRIQLIPIFQHPSLDENGFFKNESNEGLLKWSLHKNIGRILYELVCSLVQNPPIFRGSQPRTNKSTIQSNNPSINVKNESTVVVVPIPSSFPEVNALSEEELLELLNNESKLDEFIEKLKPTETIKVKTDLYENNQKSKDDNAALQKKEVDILRQEIDMSKQEYDILQNEVMDRKSKKKII